MRRSYHLNITMQQSFQRNITLHQSCYVVPRCTNGIATVSRCISHITAASRYTNNISALARSTSHISAISRCTNHIMMHQSHHRCITMRHPGRRRIYHERCTPRKITKRKGCVSSNCLFACDASQHQGSACSKRGKARSVRA